MPPFQNHALQSCICFLLHISVFNAKKSHLFAKFSKKFGGIIMTPPTMKHFGYAKTEFVVITRCSPDDPPAKNVTAARNSLPADPLWVKFPVCATALLPIKPGVVEPKYVATVLHDVPFLSCIDIASAPTLSNRAVAITEKLMTTLPLLPAEAHALYDDKYLLA